VAFGAALGRCGHLVGVAVGTACCAIAAAVEVGVASGGQWWWSGSLGCRGRRQVQVWSSPGLVALSCSLTLLLGPLCATGVIWCSGLECWSRWGWGSDGVFPRRWLWSNASPWRRLALVASEVEVVLATLIWQWLSSSPLRTGMAGFLKQRVKVLPGSLCQHLRVPLSLLEVLSCCFSPREVLQVKTQVRTFGWTVVSS
jgi:hypothetical protein